MLDTEFSEEFQLPIEIIKVSRKNVEYFDKKYRFRKLTDEGKTEVLMYTSFISLLILKPKLSHQEWEQLANDVFLYSFSAIKKLKPDFNDDQIEFLLENRFINLPSEIMVLAEKIAINIGFQRYFFFYESPFIEHYSILDKNPSEVEFTQFNLILNDITNFTFQYVHQLIAEKDRKGLLKNINESVVISSEEKIIENLLAKSTNKKKPIDSEKKEEELINSDNIPHSNSATPNKPSQKIEKPKRFRILKVFVLIFIFLSGIGYFIYNDQILASFNLISNNEEKNIEDEWQKYSWLNHRSKVFLFQNGDTIKEVFTKKEWDALCKQKTPAYCHVENNAENDEKYGLLYNWWAISDSRNICPEGYRLANENDFLVLSKDSVFNQNANQIINHFPGYKNENGYYIGKDKLLTVWFNQARYKGCYEACIISENRIKQDCYASTHAYSILLIPE
jgi:hypothetical protein